MTKNSAGAIESREKNQEKSQETCRSERHVVVVMDAECALCSWGARVIARRDAEDRFRILPSSNPRGRALLQESGLDPDAPESWLALEPDGEILKESDAVISVGRRLSGPFAWAALALGAIPRGARNRVYRLVARNRYRWFGKTDLCAIPCPELRRRLLKG